MKISTVHPLENKATKYQSVPLESFVADRNQYIGKTVALTATLAYADIKYNNIRAIMSNPRLPAADNIKKVMLAVNEQRLEIILHGAKKANESATLTRKQYSKQELSASEHKEYSKLIEMPPKPYFSKALKTERDFVFADAMKERVGELIKLIVKVQDEHTVHIRDMYS